MNKIDTIRINNFKFFQITDAIKLSGSHLLLYGENGSGKSSLYWALYSLFEASLKGNDDEIKKYFSKIIKVEDSLINIYAPEVPPGSDNFNSFVEIITDDSVPVSYKISKTDVSIRKNPLAQYVNYASDFINFRMLLSFSAFRHSDRMDLFDVFLESVLKYVQFSRIEITRDKKKMILTNAFDIWKQIEIGPEWVDSVKSKNPRKILAYKGSPEWIEFNSLVSSFNDSLQKLIDYINIHGPNYFQRLGYSFTYILSFEPASFIKKDTKYNEIPFKIRIRIPDYDSIPDSVLKPQSFLNEAKLSAMAISIRLAILSQKLRENCLKFIVLDDLLISLDMRNREKVLDLLLSPEFSDNYQLLILSHDRMFYQMAKHKIKENLQTNWVYFEMYEKRAGGKSSALVLEEIGYLGKAANYLEQNELDVAANFLRKEAESFCKEVLPGRLALRPDGGYKDLSGLITEALSFAKLNNLTVSPFENLDKHRKFVLNPGSHDSYDVPKYKNEIEDCFNNLIAIRNILIKLILPRKSELQFELSNGTDIFRFEIVLAEDLKLIKEKTNVSIIPRVFTNYDVFLNNIKTQADTQHGIVSLGDLFTKFYTWSDKSKNPDFWEEVIISSTGQPLKTIRSF